MKIRDDYEFSNLFMSYITSIEKAFIVFPFIALLFTIPFVLHQYHKYGAIHKLRVLIIYSFIFYLISIYFLVILPLPKMEMVVWKPGMIRLIPFQFILDFMRETSFIWSNPSTYIKSLLEPCVYTVVFNVFMFVPFGMYLRYYFQCDWKQTIGYSFLLSLFFEVTQLTGLYFIYPYPYRIFDVDDLLINTLGGLIGYASIGLFHFLPTRNQMDADTRILGEQVSSLRRITVFCLDFSLYSVLCFFMSLYPLARHPIILFFLYYGMYPLFSGGKTIGSQFLNVTFDAPNDRWIRILIRYIVLYLYYVGIPIGILFGTVSFIVWFNHQVMFSIVVVLICLLLIFLFYVINIVQIIRRKKRFYDSMLQISYRSTIQTED